MDVIGVGFGRTGTASLKGVLELLGFGPCYHMREIRREPARAADWLAVAAGTERDWSRVLAGYRSTVDWPAATYWRDLVDAYPHARVILTVRDPDEWYASVERTLYQQDLGPRPDQAGFAAMRHAVVWDGVFDGRFADRTHAIERFRQHNADVVAHVAADRLLVYRVGDDWAPLCDFVRGMRR